MDAWGMAHLVGAGALKLLKLCDACATQDLRHTQIAQI